MTHPLQRLQTRFDVPWAGGMALALALAVPVWYGPQVLAHGGLAPVAVATVVAFFVGVPLAQAEWQTGALDPRTRWNRGASALAELWSLLLVGAIAAPALQGSGWTGLALSAVTAAGLGALAIWSGPLVATGLAVVAVGVSLAGAAAAPAVPWTLLQPHWESWTLWLPGSMTAGLLLAGAGLGQWMGGPAPIPGAGRMPWATAGAALLAVVALSVRYAGTFEATAELTADPWTGIVTGVAALAAFVAVVGRNGTRQVRARRTAGAWLATAWFAAPAAGLLPLWWGTLLPLGIALVALRIARDARGTTRWTTGAASVGALLAAGLGWTGLPPSPVEAALAAAMVVVTVWVVGTRILVEGE